MKEESAPADRVVVNPEISAPSTFHPPQYTMQEIYAAIPPHCFHSNTLISLAYVFRDLTFALTLALLASQISHLQSPHIRFLAWATYSFCQGLVFTGIWELAHECGHGALSKHRWFNHAVGLALHSSLFTPYHSWRFTHQTHHKHTNHLGKDIAFVPDTREQHLAAKVNNPFSALPFWELAEDTPIVALITLFFHQLIAFPIYLTLNNFALERMRGVAWWKRSHFYFGGDGPNFRPRHFKEIVVSDLGIAVVVLGLCMAGRKWGWGSVLCYYGVPYLWTNHWICEFWIFHPPFRLSPPV
jgi:omega-6 fatty acid desaturase / acyl-lipid omega-6 desaturase (Delta-12 desaturase)